MSPLYYVVYWTLGAALLVGFRLKARRPLWPWHPLHKKLKELPKNIGELIDAKAISKETILKETGLDIPKGFGESFAAETTKNFIHELFEDGPFAHRDNLHERSIEALVEKVSKGETIGEPSSQPYFLCNPADLPLLLKHTRKESLCFQDGDSFYSGLAIHENPFIEKGKPVCITPGGSNIPWRSGESLLADLPEKKEGEPYEEEEIIKAGTPVYMAPGGFVKPFEGKGGSAIVGHTMDAAVPGGEVVINTDGVLDLKLPTAPYSPKYLKMKAWDPANMVSNFEEFGDAIKAIGDAARASGVSVEEATEALLRLNTALRRGV